MKIVELLEDVSKEELKKAELYANILWNTLGVKIEFSPHFFDRINDVRNEEPITFEELLKLIKKEYKTHGESIANLHNTEAVMKDLESKINVPFVIRDLGKLATRDNRKLLVTKTIYKLSNFKTHNRIYPVNELFKKDTKSWKWDYNSDTEAEATFVVGDIQYKFYAYSEGPESTRWEIEFKIEEGGPRGNRYGITGTGNSAQVMSTVVSILREFLKKYQGRVTQLVFSAKEGSRRALYARMVQRLLPTWKLEQGGRDFSVTAP